MLRDLIVRFLIVRRIAGCGVLAVSMTSLLIVAQLANDLRCSCLREAESPRIMWYQFYYWIPECSRYWGLTGAKDSTFLSVHDQELIPVSPLVAAIRVVIS